MEISVRLLVVPAIATCLQQSASGQIPQVGTVLNAASFALSGEPGHAVALGSLVSIFGNQLAPATLQAGSIPLPERLGDVSVRFNGVPAPLLFVSERQINAQLPWDLVSFTPPGTTDTVRVEVSREGILSASLVEVARFSPGIFTTDGRMAVAVNAQDYSLAQPDGSIPDSVTRPVPRGVPIVIYANGLGPLVLPVETGHLGSQPVIATVATPRVLIGGIQATVLFSGLAPDFVGVNQVNAIVPPDAPTGDAVPLQISTGDVITSSRVTIAIRP